MKVTNFSLSNKDVLGLIPQINQLGLNNLSESGRLKRKKVLGEWRYEKTSVNSLIQQLKVDEYLTYSETKEMLETNGIRDFYRRYSDKNDTMKCKYVRFTKQFPMSVSNLIKHNYLDIDKDISPMMIKKESVLRTIKHFLSVRNNGVKQPSVSKPKKQQTQPKPSNNSDYYKLLLSDLLEKLG